jgi:hypothetical protein
MHIAQTNYTSAQFTSVELSARLPMGMSSVKPVSYQEYKTFSSESHFKFSYSLK